MAQVPIDRLIQKSGSLYKLVLLAAKRAKELADGSPSLIETPKRKITTVALEEILSDKVYYKAVEPEAGSGKRKSASSKEEKKKRAA